VLLDPGGPGNGEVRGAVNDPLGAERIGFEGSVVIYRKDWA